MSEQQPGGLESSSSWDHGSHEEFLAYYAEQALSKSTLERFISVRDMVLRMLPESLNGRSLDVADIGCGPGAQASLWAELGHRVYGLDVNEDFLDLARKRTQEQGYTAEFHLGSATELPWADESMDVVLLPELLEHVADWQACLDEATRVLRPGGALYVSTTNTLCPKQQEFLLPLYSWYPAPMKRRYEKLAVTTRPEIANFAKYPAVNWFTPYQLKRALKERGFDLSHDRFDCMDISHSSTAVKMALGLMRLLPPVRLLGHMATPYSSLLAIKNG